MTGGAGATFTAFRGHVRLTSGSLADVALELKARHDRGERELTLVLEDLTGEPLDLDLRGTPEDVLARLAHHPHVAAASPAPRRAGPGRPRLGVVSREVTLLPRHWEWLGRQPGGASAALRRLVEDARRAGSGAERARQATQAADRFLWAVAGDLPGCEEVSRALYAGRHDRARELTRAWPGDVRAHLGRLLEAAGDAGR